MKLFALLLTLLLSVAVAFIKPVQPTQVGKAASIPQVQALDNIDIAADASIQPARKCGFCFG
jgi:hypothetical protein